jgi:2-methylcitrate dehydratase PrpD
VGIEVAGRVTEAIPPDDYQIAYQSTATMAGGLRENFGTMTKPFHSGRAAESGVIAAQLAKSGFTAAPDILEARRGFFLAMGGKHDDSHISGRLGAPHFLIDPGLHIERYPCAILVHPAIREIIQVASSENLRPEDIESIKVHVSEVVTSTLNHPRPATGLEAKFSVAFPLALALVQRRVGLGDFTDRKVRDPKIAAVMEKFEVIADPTIGQSGGNEVTARIEIALRDGRRLKRLAKLERGSEQKWIDQAELQKKFSAAASQAISEKKVESLWQLCAKLDQLNSVAPLLSLIRKGK